MEEDENKHTININKVQITSPQNRDEIKKLVTENNDEKMADIEYTKCVLKALEEAIDENENVFPINIAKR